MCQQTAFKKTSKGAAKNDRQVEDLLSDVWCLLSAVSYLLSAVCCIFSDICCLMSDVCCLLYAVCFLFSFSCFLISFVCSLLIAHHTTLTLCPYDTKIGQKKQAEDAMTERHKEEVSAQQRSQRASISSAIAPGKENLTCRLMSAVCFLLFAVCYLLSAVCCLPSAV
jgi:ABC-type protease/lipase transport system fused ATPase/permease subunit